MAVLLINRWALCPAFRIIDREFAVHKIFNGDRESIRHKAAEAAILELARCLGEI